MSRPCEITIVLKGLNPGRVVEVKAALNESWGFYAWIPIGHPDAPVMIDWCVKIQDTLCGGITESQCAQDIATDVFVANGGPCDVEVRMTQPDDVTYESYSYDESDYEELTKDA